MKLIKRGDVWWVDFVDLAGKRRRMSTGIALADKAAANQKAAEIVSSTGAAVTQQRVLTLGQALERTFVEHWAKTRSGYIMRRTVDVISRELGHVPVHEVDYSLLKAYCGGLLARELAPATVNRRMSCIGVTLRECSRRGEIAARPDMPHYREDNKRERYMTPEEEAKVLQWLSDKAESVSLMGDSGEPWLYVRTLATFLLDTGFRFSEAFTFALKDGHADLSHGTTKTGEGRRVPLTPRALEAAAHLLASPIHARLRADRSPKGTWDWVSHRWGCATKACSIPDVTLHILRHTCASRLVQRGVNIYVVSKWLGHSSVKVTERYAKLAPDTFSLALAALQGGPANVEGLHGTRLLHPRTDSTEERHTVLSVAVDS